MLSKFKESQFLGSGGSGSDGDNDGDDDDDTLPE
jgi:hypothetical protein